MAYVPIQQKQLEDLTTNGGGVVTSSGGSNDSGTTAPNASSITQATAAPGTAPSQFVNFQDMIDANQGATTDYAKNVGNLIGLGDTTNSLLQNTTDANSQVNSGYTDVGDDVVDRVLANPSDTNFEGYSTLKSILGGGGYRGPTSAADIYKGSQQALQNLGDKSSTLNDTSGLKSLLLEHPNQGTTTGGAALDAALLANTKGSKDEISNVQKQVAGLQDQYKTDVAGTQSAIDQKKADAAARVSAITGKASGALGDIRGTAQQALAAKTAQEQADVDAFTQASKSGDFTKLRTLIPGLDDAALSSIVSQLTDKPTDFSQYTTVEGPNLTEGNVVSDADRARYEGINNTFGLNAAQLAAAGTDARAAFDQNSALAALNARLAAQRAIPAPVENNPVTHLPGTINDTGLTGTVQQGGSGTGAGTSSGGVGESAGGGEGGSGASGTAGTGTAGSVGGVGIGPDGVAVGNTTGISNSVASAIGAVASAVTGVPGLSVAANAANAAVNNAANNSAASVNAANADSNSATNGSVGDTAAATAGTSGTGGAAAAAGAAAASAASAAGASAAAAGAAGQAAADAAVGGASPSAAAAAGAAAAAAADSAAAADDGDAASADGDAGDSGGGGGGGGGKIICTAMNDLYGLPYRENKIWLMYAKRHLTPNHETGYHKVFLPLVDYGFKQGDGITHRAVRSALIWIGKNRTRDIKNELAGKPRNPVHKFLRAVIEPTLALIGSWSRK